MAVSQTLTLTESDVSTSANTSKVRILWKSTQTGESWNGYTRTAKYYVSINGGAETEYSVTYTLPKNSTATIVDTTIVVTHKTDGKGTVTVRTWMDTDISAGVVEQTKSLTLTAIPRSPVLNSIACNSAYFTGTFTYQFTPKVATYYNELLIMLDLDSGYYKIKSIPLGRAATQQTGTFKLDADDISKIYNYLPSATKGDLVFWVSAYSDSEYTNSVGSTSSAKTLSLSIPNDTNTQPTMTMKLDPVSSDSSLGSLYAKGLSKVKATFTSGAGKYGATPVSYKLTVAGKDYASPYTSDYLATTGDITVKGTITDTRGYSRTYNETITVYNYTRPTLDTLTCSSNFFNGGITYKYTPPNNVFYTRCVVALGSKDIRTENHIRASGQQPGGFEFTEEEITEIYEALPNSASGKLKFTFQAFTDSGYTKQIGADSIKEITLSIPDIEETKPEAELTPVAVNSLADDFAGLYIKGKSKVKATFGNGECKYGASVKSYTLTVGSKSITKSSDVSLTSTYISTLNITVTGTVTDSRGFSRTYTQEINVIDYAKPQILPVSGEGGVIAARCNVAGALDENGGYLLIAAKRNYSKVVSGDDQKNFCTLEYRVKVEGGSYSDWETLIEKRAESDEIIEGPVSGVTLEAKRTYVVQIRAVDDIGEQVTTQIFVPSQKVFMHRAGSINSLGIGKYAEEENTVDIADDMTVKVRGNLIVGETKIGDTNWASLGLSTSVWKSDYYYGRNTSGNVWYRVIDNSHVYIAFNCAFTYSGGEVQVNGASIPEKYRPPRNVHSMCAVNNRAVARIRVNSDGNIIVDFVQSIATGAETTTHAVNWIDGYIDYWI